MFWFIIVISADSIPRQRNQNKHSSFHVEATKRELEWVALWVPVECFSPSTSFSCHPTLRGFQVIARQDIDLVFEGIKKKKRGETGRSYMDKIKWLGKGWFKKKKIQKYFKLSLYCKPTLHQTLKDVSSKL